MGGGCSQSLEVLYMTDEWWAAEFGVSALRIEEQCIIYRVILAMFTQHRLLWARNGPQTILFIVAGRAPTCNNDASPHFHPTLCL